MHPQGSRAPQTKLNSYIFNIQIWLLWVELRLPYIVYVLGLKIGILAHCTVHLELYAR